MANITDNQSSLQLSKVYKKALCAEKAKNPKKSHEQLAEWLQREFRLHKPPSQSSVSRALAGKQIWEKITDKHELKTKRSRNVKFPELEEAFAIWVFQRQENKTPICQDLIKETGRRMAEELDISEGERPKFSNGWMRSFCRRNRLRKIKMYGESGSVDDEAVDIALPDLRSKVTDYALCDVFNFDETGLFYQLAPDRTIASRQIHGSKKVKARITIGFCCNADGS